MRSRASIQRHGGRLRDSTSQRRAIMLPAIPGKLRLTRLPPSRPLTKRDADLLTKEEVPMLPKE
eukprot:7509678-Pyramimonas_sp.AAC.2